MTGKGAQKSRITVKIAGGAKMFEIPSNGHKIVAGSAVHSHGHGQNSPLHIHREGGNRQVHGNAGQTGQSIDKGGNQDVAHFDHIRPWLVYRFML